MNEIVFSIEEALEWFLDHHAGGVLCRKENGKEKICYSYAEAKTFFET